MISVVLWFTLLLKFIKCVLEDETKMHIDSGSKQMCNVKL
jgi:hypothetical protein